MLYLLTRCYLLVVWILCDLCCRPAELSYFRDVFGAAPVDFLLTRLSFHCSSFHFRPLTFWQVTDVIKASDDEKVASLPLLSQPKSTWKDVSWKYWSSGDCRELVWSSAGATWLDIYSSLPTIAVLFLGAWTVVPPGCPLSSLKVLEFYFQFSWPSESPCI